MQKNLFDGKSKMGLFVFKKLLAILESSLRYRFNNPEKLVKASGIKSGQTVLEVRCGSGFFTVSASEMTFLKVKELVAVLKTICGVLLGEYVRDIFDKYDNSGNSYYKQVIQRLIGLERYSYHDFTNYLLDELFLNIGSGKLIDFKLKLLELFEEELISKADKKEGEAVQFLLIGHSLEEIWEPLHLVSYVFPE